MAIYRIASGNVRSCRNSFHSCHWVALLALWYFSGCSLQGFDYLTKGGASSVGGSDQSGGGTSDNPQGGTANTGGANTGGVPAGGANTGGALNTGGISSGGTLASTAPTGDGGPDDLSGCAFTQTGGKLLVPPSQGFETDLVGWTTTSSRATALSRVAGNGENCEGNWYMSCDGSQRVGNWDGPTVDVATYVTVGHTYVFSVAVRQTLVSAPSSATSMRLVVSRACPSVSTIYDPDLATRVVSTSWVRLTGPFTPVLPSGCTALTSVKLYVVSNEASSPYISFDVDDFKLIDLSAH